MQIRITPQEMEEVANTFQSGAEQCQDVIDRLNSTMDGLLNNWEGVTQKAYYQEFQEQKQNMTNFVSLLNLIHDDLVTIAGRFREADQQF